MVNGKKHTITIIKNEDSNGVSKIKKIEEIDDGKKVIKNEYYLDPNTKEYQKYLKD